MKAEKALLKRDPKASVKQAAANEQAANEAAAKLSKISKVAGQCQRVVYKVTLVVQ